MRIRSALQFALYNEAKQRDRKIKPLPVFTLDAGFPEAAGLKLDHTKGETSMKLSNNELISSLNRFGIKATVQENSNQLLATFSQNGNEYPAFIRQLNGGNLLQILTFVPCTIDNEAYFDVSRLLHMINKELDMPGFCCDEETKTVFYRVVIPCINSQVDEPLLHAYLNTTQQVCGMFGTIVQAIAIKAMSLDEMMAKAKEMQTAKK